MMKKILLSILALCCLVLPAHGLDVPKLQGYVNDYAEMISPSARAKLEEQLRAFEQSDSTQIVILTVPSLQGEEIEEFGIKVGDAWKIGQQRKDNGAILIVSKQDRKIRIEVGRGLEGNLTDLLAGRIVDQVISPRFKQGDYDGGFLNGVSAMIAATRGEFKAEPGAVRGQKGFPPFLTFLLFLGVFVLILGSISRVLGGIAGGIGLPSLLYATKALVPFGLVAVLVLAVFGFLFGALMPGLFSSGRHGRHRRGGGFFFGPGSSGGWHSSGGGGGFSGGGGSFGGGGASGGW